MKIFKKVYIISFWLFLISFTISAQVIPEYRFNNISDITSRAISNIAQDGEGFIWIATQGLGINRFSGTHYKSYKATDANPNGINSSLVHISYVDRHNRLWVGTEGGLNLYDNQLEHFVSIQLNKGIKDEKNIAVHAIAEDDNGNIFIGTHQKGLYKIARNSLKAEPISWYGSQNMSHVLINSITVYEGMVLIGSSAGLLKYDSKNNRFQNFSFFTSSGKSQLTDPVKTLLTDCENSLWIGTISQGLFKLKKGVNDLLEVESVPISKKRILALLNTPEGDLLVGTENDGLFHINREGKVLKHYQYDKFDKNSIKSNSIWSLFLDNQERIWLGYYNDGVGVYDKLNDKFEEIESVPILPNSLQSASVTGIVKDDQNRLWIGMDGGGVDVFYPDTKQFIHLIDQQNTIAKGLDARDVQTLFIDSKDNIWVGTWDSGIYFLQKNSRQFVNYTVNNSGLASNKVLSFDEDEQGLIWIGTFQKGLNTFDYSTEKFKTYDKGEFLNELICYSDVRKVFVDSKNAIWLGGNAGLHKIERNGNNLKLISLTDKFYGAKLEKTQMSLVLSMFEDSHNNIWIGTDGAGICKYDRKTDSFNWFNQKNRFEKEIVSAIIEDDNGIMWVGGNNGLSKIDKTNDQIKNYTVSDGLISNDFNNNATLKDNLGNLYFGTYEGINYFNPDQLVVNDQEPNIYFSDLKLFNKSVSPDSQNSPLQYVISKTKEVSFSHDQSVFTIEFSAINYTHPEKIQFAYFLDGFDEDWNYIKHSRGATFTNLPAGNYTFYVKATNNDGVWSDKPISLAIEVLRPWWLTTIAIAFYALCTLLISYIIFTTVKQRVEQKRLIIQERAKRVQEEALNDKKIQFFTNISHEFRTPLTLILNPLEEIMSSSLNSLSPQIAEKHKTIYKNASRLTRLIDELMDFRKLELHKIDLQAEEIDITRVVRDVASYFKEEAIQRNIMLTTEGDVADSVVWGDISMLEKVFFNILSNAFKSTPDNGVITLAVHSHSPVQFPLINNQEYLPSIEISIEDTGSGIKAEEIKKIFNRFYRVKERNSEYYSGTGIGLEVVRSFIELHKGKIEVESTEGLGSKFRVILPLGNEHLDPDEIKTLQPKTVERKKIKPLPPVSPVQGVAVESNLVKKRILIVEDNWELRRYLKQELSDQYIISEAINGSEGYQLAIKLMPDAIITDVVMPEMDGYKFCELIKQDLKTSHIPILMLTAKAMSDDWVKGINSGADVYLKKPFELKVVRAQIKQLIHTRQLLFSKYFTNHNASQLPDNTSSLDKEFMVSISKYIELNIGESQLNVESLAAEFNLSRSQLYRKIKALTGITANEYIRKFRLDTAKEMIENNNEPINEVCYKVGFSSPSYFTKCFKTQFGLLPTELLNNEKKK